MKRQSLKCFVSCCLVSLLLSGSSQAQLPKDAGIEPGFMSWNAAWNANSVQNKENLAWLPKALTQNWTGNPLFAKRRMEIETGFARASNPKAFVEDRKKVALAIPSSLNAFSWGYSDWLWRSQTKNFSGLWLVLETMERHFVLDAEYIRLMFFMPRIVSYSASLYAPLGEKLLKLYPKDEKIKSRQLAWLKGIPTLAARQQSLLFLNEQINKSPRVPRSWGSLGGFYKTWWIKNQTLAQKSRSSNQKALAMNLARRDAKLALDAYKRSIALTSPDHVWRKKYGPEIVKQIEDWLASN